jgi:hypothetical protein
MALCSSCRPLQGSTSSYGHPHLVRDGTAFGAAPADAGFLDRETVFLCHCNQCGGSWCFGAEAAVLRPHWFPADRACAQPSAARRLAA